MAVSEKNPMGKPKLKVVADRGYFSGPEIRTCDLNNISPYVAKPLIDLAALRKTSHCGFLAQRLPALPSQRTMFTE
jgi:hypothetical protein